MYFIFNFVDFIIFCLLNEHLPISLKKWHYYTSIYEYFRYQGTIKRHVPNLDITNKTFEEIHEECLSRNILFEDPEFPADDSALFFSRNPRPGRFEWKRPHVYYI